MFINNKYKNNNLIIIIHDLFLQTLCKVHINVVPTAVPNDVQLHLSGRFGLSFT